ncbi:transcriptional repressor LexA [Kallotenue papyrolyticum]|uniref:transcriptional repressor LexA n=1 Tax=Kallotenue papyrolyticum TaxID=1325125 RepID=UPI00047853A0|nr:transcriptional repressor LexA [Kallotenue papyrolyticum]
MEGLTQRQKNILNYIQRFVQENGYPPAIRNIQNDLKISSTSVVAYNLKKLEERGLLSRDARFARGMKLPRLEPAVTSPNVRQVPFAGYIAAGQPIPSPDQADPNETVDVPAELIPERLQDVYALRVKGNSMIDALIADGDLVLMRYTQQVENGQMAAVRVIDRNEVTLKKVYFEGNKLRLQPANPTMEAWTEDASNVEIQGRVVGVMRMMA